MKTLDLILTCTYTILVAMTVNLLYLIVHLIVIINQWMVYRGVPESLQALVGSFQ
jgi:hypothetical protein